MGHRLAEPRPVWGLGQNEDSIAALGNAVHVPHHGLSVPLYPIRDCKKIG